MAARQRNFRATMSFLLIKKRMNVKLSCLILVIKSQVFLFPTFASICGLVKQLDAECTLSQFPE